MPESLWPDFDVGTVTRSPKTVIEQAGDGLEKKTNGKVTFTVGGVSIENNIVSVSCHLFVPNLYYLFPFMRAKFPVDKFYPVTLVPDKLDDIVVNNEVELMASLSKIFNAPSTVETIRKLMSLAQG